MVPRGSARRNASLSTADERTRARAEASPLESSASTPTLHLVCERDAGLFSLIQQAVAHIPWARRETRIPVVYFGERTCYWSPRGYRGAETVWEYYFEPVVADFSVARISSDVRAAVSRAFPDQSEVGHFVNEQTFVSNHYGDHPSLKGKTLSIPYLTGNPNRSLRRTASDIIEECVRPRAYIRRKVDAFFDANMREEEMIGVHIRGTDAVSEAEVRTYRRGSLNLPTYRLELERLIQARPKAKILVATDAESSIAYLTEAFGGRVIAYDAIRHESGEAAGAGPTGCIMPAYIAGDRERAAQNGEEAVIEYLLLARCNYLVHNGASLAATVLLKEPELQHLNTHRPA
jgi:hypothetical protein